MGVTVAHEQLVVEVSPEEAGVSRRQFFNRALTATFGSFVAVLGIELLAFMWPRLKGGFGASIDAGAVADLIAATRTPDGGVVPAFIPEARAYVVPVDDGNLSAQFEGKSVAAGGLMALYQRCVHLGCRVPWCATSQGFECPCHGSKYDGIGEYFGGPAPRNLDRFVVEVIDAQFIIHTGDILQTPRAPTRSVAYPQGPSCIGAIAVEEAGMSSSLVITLAVIGGVAWLAFLGVSALRTRGKEQVPQNLAQGRSDEELETSRLERFQQVAVLISGFMAVSLPLYFLGETQRQESFVDQFHEESVARGEHLVEEFACFSCHGAGGSGGSASYIEKRTGVTVSWSAPSLNDVLYRYSPDEVNFWVTYGRPNTPMPPWGVAGGGAMNEAQVADIVAYLGDDPDSAAGSAGRDRGSDQRRNEPPRGRRPGDGLGDRHPVATGRRHRACA